MSKIAASRLEILGSLLENDDCSDTHQRNCSRIWLSEKNRASEEFIRSFRLAKTASCHVGEAGSAPSWQSESQSCSMATRRSLVDIFSISAVLMGKP